MQRLDESQINFENNKNVQKLNKQQSNIEIHYKCIGNNFLSQFCISQKCQNIIKFMCHDQQCKCNEKHFECIKKSIHSVLKAINDKICQNINKVKENISQIFTRLIDKISLFEQNCLKQFDNHFNFLNVTELQSKFYSIFVEQKEQNFKQLNNKKLQKLSNIIENDKNQYKNSYFFTKYQEQIQNYQKNCHQVSQLAKIRIFNIFQTKNMKQQIIKSSIIKNDVQITNLINFFNQGIKAINLKFKASQNEFDIQKYYQKCGHLQNTIIICETDNNKIIGGYTPLTFNPVGYDDYELIADYTGLSFLFSLTNNKKFQLNFKDQAIYRSRDKQFIGFGYGPTFHITHSANTRQEKYFNLYFKTYVNYDYNENCESYLELTGSSDGQFKVKEWEVFQVQFQQL